MKTSLEPRPGDGPGPRLGTGLAGMQLLLIEDDRDAAGYLVRALTESGFRVDHAADGRDGLFLATERPPRLKRV